MTTPGAEGVVPAKVTPDQEAEVRERIERDLADHEMTVLRDDGLYRHLRFMRSEEAGKDGWRSAYWYDLITWPGVLAISGDCGAFMFSRIRDMFDFFETDRGGINPYYWSEKLTAPAGRRAVRVYSEDVARARVAEWLADVREDDDLDDDKFGSLRAAVDEQILSCGEMTWEDGLRGLLNDFEHDGYRMRDTWEWDVSEWDWQFLWCCWAIVKGIAVYRAKMTPTPELSS